MPRGVTHEFYLGKLLAHRETGLWSRFRHGEPRHLSGLRQQPPSGSSETRSAAVTEL